MADVILSCIVENLAGKAGSLVSEEVCLAWNLEKDLKRLEQNFSIIKAVLLDAEEKQAQNRDLHLWLRRLKNFCYAAEDVFDELEYEGLRKQVVRQYGSTRKKVCRFFTSTNPVVFRFKVGHKIKDLRENLDEIVAQKSMFQLTEIGRTVLVPRPVLLPMESDMTDSFVRISKIIGRKVDKTKIMKFLLESRDESVGVIPIVGIGGLGKTTLAKMLYNDIVIDHYFESKMWVCVSEDGFDKKKIMVKMMNFFTNQTLSDYQSEQMQIFIRDKLKGNKFLLVLDDVWSVNRNEWLDLLDLLEEGKSGSKIIVTTRSNSVGKIMGTTSAHNLEALPEEDCSSLFKKIAFKEGDDEKYPNLLEIGKDIVNKCKGVPLAIRTLGALLCGKNDERDWIFIRDNDIWKLEQHKGDILPALKLSYDQLGSHLKSCFAICSIFQKDFIFKSHLLTQVWMAHGLLQSSNENEELEEIGLLYIKELCSRSLFHDIKELGNTLLFKMHDLVHDLAMSVARDECMVVNQHSKSISDGTQHLSFSGVKTLHDMEVPNNLRTITSSRLKEESSAAQFIVNKCITTCRHLRMLDIRGIAFEVLPGSIGSLIHLRYLDLSANDKIKKLPDSLWKQQNLQTLKLYGCVQLEELPRDIRLMISLRVLIITTRQKRLPKYGLSGLKCLYRLVVADCTGLEVLFEETPDLPSLRMLNILDCGNLVSLAPSWKDLAGLETLAIMKCARLNVMEGGDVQDIEFRLQTVWLTDLPQLTGLPEWIQRSSRTLQEMKILDCNDLSSLPEWLRNFKALKTLQILGSPPLIESDEGNKIAHIPNANVHWDS